ncbi:hypothetical protein CEXT_730711 [Caerostris extrusa]|uniref:YitH/HolE acetyltransferase (GNAT) domain-containing protein n=1 Tax=Caerostris extrusa TaxID=172846 RepID=A0AAV4QQ85_CAEEX|nr:hypothetical protein CEXT_730711 [Caerostris extrusa]
MHVNIRNALPSDVAAILYLAQAIGRPVSSDDVLTWMSIDPLSLFVAEVDGPPPQKRGVVGFCCAAKLNEDSGYLSLYMVQESFRGRGNRNSVVERSKRLPRTEEHRAESGSRHAGEVQAEGGFHQVDDYAVLIGECFGESGPESIQWPAMVEIATFTDGALTLGTEKGEREAVDEAFCSKCTAIQCCKPRDHHGNSNGAYGFNSEPVAVRKLFCESSGVKISNGTNTNSSRDLSRNVMTSPKICENWENKSVWNAEEIVARVVAYDRSLHNRDRSQLIRRTFFWSSCTTKVALMSGKIVGYGCLRRVITGHWMISPLYADNEVVAEAILFHLLQGFDFSNPKKGVKIYSIDQNFACTLLLKKFGFREWQTLYTAFTKHCVKLNISKIYALHSIMCGLE